MLSTENRESASIGEAWSKHDALREKKKAIIEQYGGTSGNTGSTEVQCALLTAKINYLTDHCRKHAHDFQARKGLIAAVVRRKRLLSYLQKTSDERYRTLIKSLGLRK